MLYVNNFKTLLSDISKRVDQTALFRAFGTRVRLTTNPDTISQLYSDHSYTRAAFSQRLVEHTGARNAWVADKDDVASIKRLINKRAFNKKNYDTITKEASALIEAELKANSNVDIHFVFYKAFETTFLKHLLGINLTPALQKEINEVGLFHNDAGFDTPLTKLFFLNYFSWMPNFVKAIVAPELEERHKKFDEVTDILYYYASGKTNSVYNELKDAEARGELTHEQVLGEFRMGLINANSLAVSMCWALYLLSKNPADKEQCAVDVDYARLAYMEVIRLYPPFHILAYEKKEQSKCPVHFWKTKDTEVVSVLGTHRSEKNWDNPLDFNPSRFSAGLSKIKKGSYIPFGGGDRACPGSGLAMTIGPTLMHKLSKIFTVELLEEPVPKRRIELMPLGNTIKFRITKT